MFSPRSNKCERRRRVLKARNIAFPIATAAIFLIFTSAYYFTHKEISEARASLSARANEDFHVMAHLLGKVVGRQVVKSRTLIEGMSVRHSADERELARLITARDANGLTAFGRKWAEKIQAAGFKLFMIADSKGKILLDVEVAPDKPAEASKIKTFDNPDWDARSFAFREWFNGDSEKEQQEQSEDRPYEPLKQEHISRPYWSVVWQDNEWEKRDFGPTISAPIVHEGRTVGVVAAQIPREKLDHWTKELDLKGGFGVVLSDGCVLQSHPGFGDTELDKKGTGDRIMEDPMSNGHAPGQANWQCPYCLLKKNTRQHKLNDSYIYLDPLTGERYSAAIVGIEVQKGERPLGDWHVVVQEKTTELFQSFDDIARTAGRWWIGALVVVLACIAMFWVFSDWLLKEQGRFGQIMKSIGGVLGISSRAKGDATQSGPFSGLFPRAS